MAVLANPDVIETNNVLNKIFQFSKIFGVENNQQFLYIRYFCFWMVGIFFIFQSIDNLCASQIYSDAPI